VGGDGRLASQGKSYNFLWGRDACFDEESEEEAALCPKVMELSR
jgi:hypothetical protein